jgi:hypothetical protein
MKAMTVVYFLFLQLCIGCQSKPEVSTSIASVEAKDTKMNDVLSVLCGGEDGSIDSATVFVIRVKHLSEGCEVRTGVIKKRDFGTLWYSNVKEDKLYGVFEYQNHLVLVFGKDAATLYDKTNQSKVLPFLPTTKPKTENRTIEVPDNFEPPVRIYLIKNGVVSFQKRGLFELLE